MLACCSSFCRYVSTGQKYLTLQGGSPVSHYLRACCCFSTYRMTVLPKMASWNPGYVLVLGTHLNKQLISMVFCSGKLVLIHLSPRPGTNR